MEKTTLASTMSRIRIFGAHQIRWLPLSIGLEGMSDATTTMFLEVVMTSEYREKQRRASACSVIIVATLIHDSNSKFRNSV